MTSTEKPRVEYPRIDPCADIAVFDPAKNKILLGKKHPGKERQPHNEGLLRFPGGHVDRGEDFAQAAMRELEEETMLKCCHISDLHYVNSYHVEARDKITLLFMVSRDNCIGEPEAGDDLAEVGWHHIYETHCKQLVHDHGPLLADLRKRIRRIK